LFKIAQDNRRPWGPQDQSWGELEGGRAERSQGGNPWKFYGTKDLEGNSQRLAFRAKQRCRSSNKLSLFVRERGGVLSKSVSLWLKRECFLFWWVVCTHA
jgi:hypothetical protein